MALLELSPPLKLRATDDVDAVVEGEFAVRKQLEALLEGQGMALDRLAHEAWMPSETTYVKAYEGPNVVLEVADVESVLVSKALKAPQKNERLLAEYIANGPSPRFMELADKYDLNLEQFV